jgi:hypothetical protein
MLSSYRAHCGRKAMALKTLFTSSLQTAAAARTYCACAAPPSRAQSAKLEPASGILALLRFLRFLRTIRAPHPYRALVRLCGDFARLFVLLVPFAHPHPHRGLACIRCGAFYLCTFLPTILARGASACALLMVPAPSRLPARPPLPGSTPRLSDPGRMGFPPATFLAGAYGVSSGRWPFRLLASSTLEDPPLADSTPRPQQVPPPAQPKRSV